MTPRNASADEIAAAAGSKRDGAACDDGQLAFTYRDYFYFFKNNLASIDPTNQPRTEGPNAVAVLADKEEKEPEKTLELAAVASLVEKFVSSEQQKRARMAAHKQQTAAASTSAAVPGVASSASAQQTGARRPQTSRVCRLMFTVSSPKIYVLLTLGARKLGCRGGKNDSGQAGAGRISVSKFSQLQFTPQNIIFLRTVCTRFFFFFTFYFIF